MHAFNFEYTGSSSAISIPNSFPLKNNKIVCSTCHTFGKKECTANIEYFYNYKMLRNYTSYETFCYNCHKSFNKYNPHNQINENSKIDYKTCNLCHITVPDLNFTFKNAIETLKGSPDQVCNACHQIKGVHPTGTNHLEKYIKDIDMLLLEKIFRDNNLTLYVGERNKILCVSCHYPHNFDRNLNYVSQKRRLKDLKICLYCHTK